jgi:hypothetical protein
MYKIIDMKYITKEEKSLKNRNENATNKMNVNILSRTFLGGNISGPSKVVKNTIFGLQKLGVTVSINEDINNHEINWVHDDLLSYSYAVLIQKSIIFGPNLVVAPNEFPFKNKSPASGSIFLAPSDWVNSAWVNCMDTPKYRITTWAAGIDTNLFSPKPKLTSKKIVLIYFKNRRQSDLDVVLDILIAMGYEYKIFKYGYYLESDFLEALTQAQFGIWISGTESQGIALMEALSMDLPILVVDCNHINDNYLDKSINIAPNFPAAFNEIVATSAPYFSNICGVKINSILNIKFGIEQIEKGLVGFSPRSFILEQHTLDCSARSLLSIVEEFISLNKKKSSKKTTPLLVIKIFYIWDRISSGFYINNIITRTIRILLRLRMRIRGSNIDKW